jgi:hypothetical protein
LISLIYEDNARYVFTGSPNFSTIGINQLKMINKLTKFFSMADLEKLALILLVIYIYRLMI